MPFYELVRKNHELHYTLGGVDEIVSQVERSQVMRFTNVTAAKGAATRLLTDDFYSDFQEVKWENLDKCPPKPCEYEWDHLGMCYRKLCEYAWFQGEPQKWKVLEVRPIQRAGLGIFERQIYYALARRSFTEGYTCEEIAGLLNIELNAVYPNINSLMKRKVLTIGHRFTDDNIPISVYGISDYALVLDEFKWELPDWYNNKAW